MCKLVTSLEEEFYFCFIAEHTTHSDGRVSNFNKQLGPETFLERKIKRNHLKCSNSGT